MAWQMQALKRPAAAAAGSHLAQLPLLLMQQQAQPCPLLQLAVHPVARGSQLLSSIQQQQQQQAALPRCHEQQMGPQQQLTARVPSSSSRSRTPPWVRQQLLQVSTLHRDWQQQHGQMSFRVSFKRSSCCSSACA